MYMWLVFDFSQLVWLRFELVEQFETKSFTLCYLYVSDQTSNRIHLSIFYLVVLIEERDTYTLRYPA